MAQLCKDVHNTIFSRRRIPKSDDVESHSLDCQLDTFVQPVGYRTVAFSDQYKIWQFFYIWSTLTGGIVAGALCLTMRSKKDGFLHIYSIAELTNRKKSHHDAVVYM